MTNKTPTHPWWEYVQALMTLHSLTAAQFAETIGTSGAVLTAWKREGAEPRPETARRIAHVFNRGIPEVFSAAGFATREELGVPTEPLLSNEQLLDMVRSRMVPDDRPELNSEPGEFVDLRTPQRVRKRPSTAK